MTPRTRVLAVTHVTSSFGDVLPVRELCGMARSRGVLSMVDGAIVREPRRLDRSLAPAGGSVGAHLAWRVQPATALTLAEEGLTRAVTVDNAAGDFAMPYGIASSAKATT